MIGLIEAIENKMLAPGMPIAIPETMAAKVEATLGAFQQAVAKLNILIDAYRPIRMRNRTLLIMVIVVTVIVGLYMKTAHIHY